MLYTVSYICTVLRFSRGSSEGAFLSHSLLILFRPSPHRHRRRWTAQPYRKVSPSSGRLAAPERQSPAAPSPRRLSVLPPTAAHWGASSAAGPLLYSRRHGGVVTGKGPAGAAVGGVGAGGQAAAGAGFAPETAAAAGQQQLLKQWLPL